MPDLVDMTYSVPTDDTDALAAAEAVLQIYSNGAWQEIFLLSVSTTFEVGKSSIQYDRQGKPWLRRYVNEGFKFTGAVMNILNVYALALALGRDPDDVDTSTYPTKSRLVLDDLPNPPRMPAKIIGFDKEGKAFEVTFAAGEITTETLNLIFSNTVSEPAFEMTAFEDANSTLGCTTCMIEREK